MILFFIIYDIKNAATFVMAYTHDRFLIFTQFYLLRGAGSSVLGMLLFALCVYRIALKL